MSRGPMLIGLILLGMFSHVFVGGWLLGMPWGAGVLHMGICDGKRRVWSSRVRVGSARACVCVCVCVCVFFAEPPLLRSPPSPPLPPMFVCVCGRGFSWLQVYVVGMAMAKKEGGDYSTMWFLRDEETCDKLLVGSVLREERGEGGGRERERERERERYI